MEYKAIISYIRELISRDEQPAAIEQLRILLDDSPKLDEALLKSGHFLSILRQIRSDVVNDAEANLTQNQIRQAMLELLAEIEHISSQDSLRPLTELETSEITDPLSPAFDAGFDKQAIALPYHSLQGLGFERLCYQLLVHTGKTPRFFGKSGEADLEVDIISEEGNSRTLFQCKNEKATPTILIIQKTVEKFEREWLQQAQLLPPKGIKKG